jgi:hypothetical protein
MNHNSHNLTIEKLKEERTQLLLKLAQLQETLLSKVDRDFEDAVLT